MANISNSFDAPTLNFRNPNVGLSMSNSSIPVYNSNNMITTPMGRVFTTAPPPPVPARPVQNQITPSFNTYSSPFGGFGGYSSGFNGYGGFGGYGGYGFGGYRSGFSPYSYGSGGYYNNYLPENRFIQMAEESARPMLESVQSLLHTFSSVTMMFESSFQAIYSSYMSVVGVAANFGKIRSLFGQFFSGFAIIRTIVWIYRKLLYMLGLTSDEYLKEAAWSEAFAETKDVSQRSNKINRKPTWALLVIMGFIIGGPYVLFKLMSELNPNPVPAIWDPKKTLGSLAVGLYDFQAGSQQELSFRTQDRLMIAPKTYQPQNCPGWLLACTPDYKIGLVPKNYVGIIMKCQKTGETIIDCNGQKRVWPNGGARNVEPPTAYTASTNEMQNFENKIETNVSNPSEISNEINVTDADQRTGSSDEIAENNEANQG